MLEYTKAGIDARIAAATAGAVQKAQAVRNILDYGVATGTTTTQTSAIKAALDAHPGEAFFFPPGDYRCDTGLVVSQSNTLIFAPGARLYAGAAMSVLFNYQPALPGGSYAEDKSIIGGLFDGALLANTVISIQQVLRFTFTRWTIRDGINRGLVTGAGAGAELFAYDGRLYNTGTSNVTNNIAIEANMGDSHFRDIIVRDWTTAVKDVAANRWDRIHPWISPDAGGITQMTARYPTSLAFDITGTSDMIACLSDTYRYGYKFRTNGTGFTAPARLMNCRATWSTTALPNALATANPAYVIDNSDGVGAYIDRMTVTGHAAVPGTFLLGPPTNLTASQLASFGYILGAQGTTTDSLNYSNGIQTGTFTFTPTIYGANSAGTHTYNTRSGRMVVANGVATYYVRVNATLDATTGFAGAFRIGGIPLPTGATSVRDGGGSLSYVVNVQASSVAIFASATPYVSVFAQLGAAGTTEVDIAGQGLRGKTVDIMFAVSVTHIPS